MDQSVVQHIAIEECGIRGKNLPVKFGSQNCALELAYVCMYFFLLEGQSAQAVVASVGGICLSGRFSEGACHVVGH